MQTRDICTVLLETLRTNTPVRLNTRVPDVINKRLVAMATQKHTPSSNSAFSRLRVIPVNFAINLAYLEQGSALYQCLMSSVRQYNNFASKYYDFDEILLFRRAYLIIYIVYSILKIDGKYKNTASIIMI